MLRFKLFKASVVTNSFASVFSATKHQSSIVMDIIDITITFLLLMSAGTRVETQPPKQQQIQAGASLLPNITPAWWSSHSGQIALGSYTHGARQCLCRCNLVG